MSIAIYIAVMAGVTYFIRVIPFAFFTKKCENLKQRANQLINNYINLVNSRIESETK